MASTPTPTKKNLAAARGALSRASGAQRGIIDNVEKKLGPVAPGKHNDMRSQALLNWLKKDNGKVEKSIRSKNDSEKNDTPRHERTESSAERKREGGLMAYSPSTRTVQDVMTAVKRQFGDESGVQLQDSDIIMWVNSAQAEINKRNKVMKAKSTQTSTVGQSDYTFPSDNILQIESLHYNGMLLPNMSLAQAEEDFLMSDTPVSGEPLIWYEFGGTFTLYPTPPTEQQIALFYTMFRPRSPPPLTFLGLPDKYYEQIVAYVLQQAYEMDEDWNASQAKATQFNDSLMQMSEEERAAQNMVYDRVTIVEY